MPFLLHRNNGISGLMGLAGAGAYGGAGSVVVVDKQQTVGIEWGQVFGFVVKMKWLPLTVPYQRKRFVGIQIVGRNGP